MKWLVLCYLLLIDPWTAEYRRLSGKSTEMFTLQNWFMCIILKTVTKHFSSPIRHAVTCSAEYWGWVEVIHEEWQYDKRAFATDLGPYSITKLKHMPSFKIPAKWRGLLRNKHIICFIMTPVETISWAQLIKLNPKQSQINHGDLCTVRVSKDDY